MKLLIDLGNTRLKWATLTGANLQAGGVFTHAGKPLFSELRREWVELARVDGVLVASVVAPTREDELDAYVHDRFGLHAEFLRSPAAALGVRNAYAEPARLGIDRFLALAALHAEHPRAQVLASVGTALTLDALAADGVHHGGVIVASPQLMREAVLNGTARVGTASGRCRELPDNTADAVVTGSLYAAAGTIDRFCAAAARRLGSVPALILTGGGADELAPLIVPVERTHDLVLRGLALWADALAPRR
ncbi:type III pantothenate kinase [Dokdonella soli]|uniref:Type III pantothenate kinase n=1 Tax=Dokdonella soli TaxID=529810 RepID=A0ABN1IGD9_9GAMM